MDKDEFAIKLTIKQAYVALGVAVGIVGSIFTAGTLFEYKITRVEIATLEAKQIECIEKINLTNGSKIKAAEEDRDFFKERYNVTKERLKSCIEIGEFIKAGTD